MRLQPFTVLPIVSICLLAVCPLSQAGLMTFTQVQDFNTLAHGAIVSSSNPAQTLLGSFGNVTVRGENLNDDRDLIVGFDTALGSGTRDDDLLAPFDLGNIGGPDVDIEGAGDEQGTALIIQERGEGSDGDNDGLLDSSSGSDAPADDEGRRPAGSISFDFDEAVESFGIDLLDVEGGENFSFEFFSDGELVSTVGFDEFLEGGEFFDPSAPVVFGNNSANRIVPITTAELAAFAGVDSISGFDSVTVNLGGSGALDNLLTTRSFVPEPGAACLWMMAGAIGLCGFERRKSNRINKLI